MGPHETDGARLGQPEDRFGCRVGVAADTESHQLVMLDPVLIGGAMRLSDERHLEGGGG